MEFIGRRLFGRKKVPCKEPTITQKALADFQGRDYYTMSDDRTEIADAMWDLGYIVIDMDTGRIVLTDRGQGIVDGTIATNYRVPKFLKDYVPPEV